MIASKEIGGYFEGLSRLDEHLGMGTIKEVFQAAGTYPLGQGQVEQVSEGSNNGIHVELSIQKRSNLDQRLWKKEDEITSQRPQIQYKRVRRAG